MLIDRDFTAAVSDYQYLLEKGYTSKNILKVVGDRYRLNTIQRSFLYRGMSTKNNASYRKIKLITEKETTGQPLFIDAYNLLITIHSYIKGRPVFIAADGFLRDAGELKGKISKTGILQRPVDLTIAYLKTLSPASVTFYIDQPVLNSKEISTIIDWIASIIYCPIPAIIIKETLFCSTNNR